MAAVLACGRGAVLSHRSAAALHELRATERARIEVTVPGRSGRKRPGIQIHRSTTLTLGDITKVQNIPCTTDAHATHGTRQAFERDRRRDQRLMVAGIRVVRFTWRQLRDERPRLERSRRELLGL